MMWIGTSAHALVAVLALAGILGHLSLRYLTRFSAAAASLPLLAVLVIGGVPLVLRLAWKAVHGEFGSDHLAGVSIVASALLDEYLAGAIVVLMLSGGETLEAYADVMKTLAGWLADSNPARFLEGEMSKPVFQVR